jgi:hypothetical protein
MMTKIVLAMDTDVPIRKSSLSSPNCAPRGNPGTGQEVYWEFRDEIATAGDATHIENWMIGHSWPIKPRLDGER